MKIEVKEILERDKCLSVLFDFEFKEEQVMPRFRKMSVVF